jgi:hypothetical protein
MSDDKTDKTDCGQLTTPGEGCKDDNGKRQTRRRRRRLERRSPELAPVRNEYRGWSV